MSGVNDNVIRIMCPNLTCKRILAVPNTARGKLVRCRGCGINLRVPKGREEPPTAAPVAPAGKGAVAAPAPPAKGQSAPAGKAA
jgi:hypothetical protein